MDAKHLRIQATRMSLDARSMRKQALRHNDNASNYSRHDDIDRASAEEQQAERLEGQAQSIEVAAIALAAKVHDNEKKAEEIERQQTRLKQDFEAQMKELEKQKRDLLG